MYVEIWTPCAQLYIRYWNYFEKEPIPTSPTPESCILLYYSTILHPFLVKGGKVQYPLAHLAIGYGALSAVLVNGFLDNTRPLTH